MWRLALVLALALGQDGLEQEWTEYKMKHNKRYALAEDSYRRGLFLAKQRLVRAHNGRHAAGQVSYSLGINQFSDMTEEEVQCYVSCVRGARSYADSTVPHVIPENASLPAQVDWRTRGAVSEVKDQGQCGACWAFSATGSLEGQQFLKSGNMVELSEQNLVDCSTENEGCLGGQMVPAFEYVKSNGGIDTETSYPYDSADGQAGTCRYKNDTIGSTVAAIVLVQCGSEAALQHAVAARGPVSAAIDASGDFSSYNGSGVYYNRNCSSVTLDHAVLVVGYGTQDGLDYWLVKNSWGKDWGDAGYVKMARNRNNHCGIASDASYPLV